MKTLACCAILAVCAVCISPVAYGTEYFRVSAGGTGQNNCPDSTAQVCPRGDFGYLDVHVSDIGGADDDTITVYSIVVSGNICFCPGETPQSGPLGGNKIARFYFTRMGGCGQVSFTATSSDGSSDGPTDPIFVASPDINASCVVNGIDLALFAADYGRTGRRCSDFDCDGETDAIDLTLFARAFAHGCLP